jgi:hypothetical protein
MEDLLVKRALHLNSLTCSLYVEQKFFWSEYDSKLNDRRHFIRSSVSIINFYGCSCFQEVFGFPLIGVTRGAVQGHGQYILCKNQLKLCRFRTDAAFSNNVVLAPEMGIFLILVSTSSTNFLSFLKGYYIQLLEWGVSTCAPFLTCSKLCPNIFFPIVLFNSRAWIPCNQLSEIVYYVHENPFAGKAILCVANLSFLASFGTSDVMSRTDQYLGAQKNRYVSCARSTGRSFFCPW